jgi:hypothetical protein
MPPDDCTLNLDRIPAEPSEDADGEEEEVLPDKTYGRRRGSGGLYLRGPVPWPWLLRAAALPGKALVLGLMLWQLAGMRRVRSVTFCLSRAAKDGVPLSTARRALRALERAGLVTVERPAGYGLLVTLPDGPSRRRK